MQISKLRWPRALGLAAALAITPVPMSAAAATTENFMVRTTADFVALCESSQSSATYVAAIHFCQGFASGAYQYYLALAQNSATTRYVCPPDPAPTRNQVIASFLTWMRAHQEQMAAPAVESIFRYLGETYPCADAQRAPE